MHADYHPGEIAKSYQAHGAVAISVLTEPSFFGGSLDHLMEVRSAVTIPIHQAFNVYKSIKCDMNFLQVEHAVATFFDQMEIEADGSIIWNHPWNKSR